MCDFMNVHYSVVQLLNEILTVFLFFWKTRQDMNVTKIFKPWQCLKFYIIFILQSNKLT